jgi:hypothetical protein
MVRISKAKIPRNESFILRSSVLEKALRAAGIATETSLNHYRGKYFSADFWTPWPNVPHERFRIYSGSVPAEQVRAPSGNSLNPVWFLTLSPEPAASSRFRWTQPFVRTGQYFVRELWRYAPPSCLLLPTPDPQRGRCSPTCPTCLPQFRAVFPG